MTATQTNDAVFRSRGAELGPRNFTAVGPLPGSGMPQARLARIAARRSFVEMKNHFMDAVALLSGEEGRWLQHQVRHSVQPMDLWLLRSAVFAALRQADVPSEARCSALQSCLDSVFPQTGLHF
jgi:hypothetical protein